MSAVQVPESVAREVLVRWPERGALWLANAAADVMAVCERHSVVPVRVLPARFALVVAAAAVDRSFVLRSTADPHGPQQAIAARALAGLGIGPQVHDVVTSAAGTCVVMDEVQPGTVAEGCSAAEVADLLRPLVGAPASADNLPPVSAWIRRRLQRDRLGPDVHPGATNPRDAERAHALALLDILGEDEAWSVCHGDVSLGNVLRGRDRLYLIDPRGMTGDVEYDAAVASIKAGLDVRDLSHRLQIDAARAEAWASIAVAARV